MASGCILGECPICGSWLYEDEAEFVGGRVVHEECDKSHLSRKERIEYLKVIISVLEEEERCEKYLKK